MRVSRRGYAVLAVGVALAVVATGCTSETEEAGKAGGAITITGGEPERPLVPADTTETNGGKVVDSLFTGLINYKADDASPENAAAESIDTKDAKVYTVKLH